VIGRLLILFLFIPFVELLVLIRIGNWIGFWPTLTLLVVMALLGFVMVRSQGLSVINRIKSDLSRGTPPAQGLTEGLLIIVGGVFLITPGLISDFIGLLLIFPATRKQLSKLIIPWLINKSFNNSGRFIRRW
jgi:UPF0716 protein FxsA